MLSIKDSQGLGVAAHLEIIRPVEFLSRGRGIGWKLDGAVYFFCPLTSLFGNSQEKKTSSTPWAVQLTLSGSPCFSTIFEALMWASSASGTVAMWTRDTESHNTSIVWTLCATTCVFMNSDTNEMTGNWVDRCWTHVEMSTCQTFFLTQDKSFLWPATFG